MATLSKKKQSLEKHFMFQTISQIIDTIRQLKTKTTATQYIESAIGPEINLINLIIVIMHKTLYAATEALIIIATVRRVLLLLGPHIATGNKYRAVSHEQSAQTTTASTMHSTNSVHIFLSSCCCLIIMLIRVFLQL